MSKSGALAVLCSVVLCVPPPHLLAWTQSPAPPSAQPSQSQHTLSADQLDSLVAPLALYPDPLLSQVLVASTYPLEIVQAEQWLTQNKSLTGKALADAAAKQSWDASVQALVMFPDLLKQFSQDINWVSDLGNAFLADENQVMASIQRMRQKAEQKGMLQSNQQQTVTTTAENGQNYIVIEPAQPEVIYVPQYDPAAVWGAAAYPYPPIAYPPASNFISFGAGLALGAIWGGGGWGGWGWGMGWGGGNVTINNNFISRNNFNRANVGNGNRWVHNPSHRGNVPYKDRGTANRYGGNRGNMTPRPTPRDTQNRLGQGGANRSAPGGGAGRGNPGRGDLNRPGAGRGSQPGQGGGPARGGANRVSPGARPSQGSRPQMQSQPSRGGANRAMPSGGGVHRGGGGGYRGGGGGGGARMGGGGGGHRGGGGGGRRR